MIFTTVTTLLRHLARAQKPDETQTCGRTFLKLLGEKKTSKYKSEGNFSHYEKFSEIPLYVLHVISKIDNVDMFREL